MSLLIQVDLDLETRVYYYRHRVYAAELGRFCSRDPIGYRGSPWNLREYNNGSPADRTDPFGKASCCCLLGQGGCIAFYCFGSCGPYDLAAQAMQCARAGQHAADEAELTGHEHEAMRHCVASGCLALRTGCACAWCIGTTREGYQNECLNQAPRNGERGNNNNRHGRRIAGCTGADANMGTPEPMYLMHVIADCLRHLRNMDIGDGPPPRVD